MAAELRTKRDKARGFTTIDEFIAMSTLAREHGYGWSAGLTRQEFNAAVADKVRELRDMPWQEFANRLAAAEARVRGE